MHMHRITSTPHSFNARIAEEKKRLEAEAARIKAGAAHNEVMKKLRQLDVAAHLNEWVSSPGLQSPR
jgi:hypothetical protein